MLSLLALLQISAAPVASAVPALPAIPRPWPDGLSELPLAQRPRGATVYDAAGSPLGVIDASDAARVTVTTTNHKLQVPANALQKVAGRLTLLVGSQQIDALASAVAANQAKVHPAARPTTPPRGFAELPEAVPPTQPRAIASPVPPGGLLPPKPAR